MERTGQPAPHVQRESLYAPLICELFDLYLASYQAIVCAEGLDDE